MNTMNCMSAFFSLFFLLQYKIQKCISAVNDKTTYTYSLSSFVNFKLAKIISEIKPHLDKMFSNFKECFLYKKELYNWLLD